MRNRPILERRCGTDTGAPTIRIVCYHLWIMSIALVRYQDGFEHRGAERPVEKQQVAELPSAMSGRGEQI